MVISPSIVMVVVVVVFGFFAPATVDGFSHIHISHHHCLTTAPSFLQGLPRQRQSILKTKYHQDARLWSSRIHHNAVSSVDATTALLSLSSSCSTSPGLYRNFAELAWNKLHDFVSAHENELSSSTRTRWEETTHVNQSPAKGFPPRSVVDITIQSMMPAASSTDRNKQKQENEGDKDNAKKPLIRYARYALLETKVVAATNTKTTTKTTGSAAAKELTNTNINTHGIQVLNFVIFPAKAHLPVWGADFVSLPGGKHLLLLDAQPMHASCQAFQAWTNWYHSVFNSSNNNNNTFIMFPWGGDFSPSVQRYVSKHALWTRMSNSNNNNNNVTTTTLNATDNNNVHKMVRQDDADSSSQLSPVDIIQTKLPAIFEEHLDLYLQLLMSQQDQQNDDSTMFTKGSNNAETAIIHNHHHHWDAADKPGSSIWLDDYLKYRLTNDPARPMLKSLYGEEWTERMLHDVLFPLDKLLLHEQQQQQPESKP